MKIIKLILSAITVWPSGAATLYFTNNGVDAVFAESVLVEARKGWDEIAEWVCAAKRIGMQPAGVHRPAVLND